MLIQILLVIFDQLLHLVVHSTDPASNIDELQRNTSNFPGLANNNDGGVSVQEEQIRGTSNAYKEYS